MVEIIPKQAAGLPLWQNILFYFSLALLLGAILSYFVLDNLQKRAMTTIDDLNEALTREKTKEEKGLEKKILLYEKKIRDFPILLGKHKRSSSFFEIFENLTHPQAWFFNLDLDLKEKKALFSGETESFQTLGQQLIIFQNSKDVQQTNLSGISIGEKGKINFSFTLLFEPGLFK